MVGSERSEIARASAMAEARLTARLTSRAETKVGHSDPVVPRGRAIAQRIIGTSMSAHHILGLEQVPRVRLFAD